MLFMKMLSNEQGEILLAVETLFELIAYVYIVKVFY